MRTSQRWCAFSKWLVVIAWRIHNEKHIRYAVDRAVCRLCTHLNQLGNNSQFSISQWPIKYDIEYIQIRGTAHTIRIHCVCVCVYHDKNAMLCTPKLRTRSHSKVCVVRTKYILLLLLLFVYNNYFICICIRIDRIRNNTNPMYEKEMFLYFSLNCENDVIKRCK